MHRHGRIAEHGFRPRRRNRDELAGLYSGIIYDRIFKMPKMALGLDLHHFEIGDRGLKLWVPIDEALILIDQAFLIELDKHLGDGARQPFVERKALARPVAGGTEPF